MAAYFLQQRREQPIGGDTNQSLIVCIGDSFTYGFGVTPDQAYPAVLQQLLNDRNFPYRVANMGYPGLSTTEMIWGVQEATKFKKIALIIVLGGWNANNADFAAMAEQRSRSVPWLTHLDTVGDHSRLYRLLKHVATSSSRTVHSSEGRITPQSPRMDLYNFQDYQRIARDNLRRMAIFCREKNVPLVFLNYPSCEMPLNDFSKIEYYHIIFGRTPLSDDDYIIPDRRKNEIAIHSVIRAVGAGQGVPVIDLQEHFAAAGRDDLFQTDFHHPTATGYALMARAVADYLSNRLKSFPDPVAARRAQPPSVTRIRLGPPKPN